MANNIFSCLLDIFLRHVPVSGCLYWEALRISTGISCRIPVIWKRYGTRWNWNKFWNRWRIWCLIKIDAVILVKKRTNRHPVYILMFFSFDLGIIKISDDSRSINSSQEVQNVTKWTALSLCPCSDHASNTGSEDRCLWVQTALREFLTGKIIY